MAARTLPVSLDTGRVRYVPLTGRNHPVTFSATDQDKGDGRTYTATLVPNQVTEVPRPVYNLIKQKYARMQRALDVPDASDLGKRIESGDPGFTAPMTNLKMHFEFLDD